MSATGPAIKATLGLDTAPLKKDLQKAQAQTSAFAKNFKENIEKFAGALAGTQIAQFVRSTVEGFKDIGNAVELTAEQTKELRRVNAGLTREQADELAGLSGSYQEVSDAAAGFFGKTILGLRNVLKEGKGLGSFLDPFKQDAEPVGASITAEERIRIQEAAAQKAKKIEDENLKLRQKISDIDDDIVAKQQDAAEKRMDTAGKIAESERRIREIKSAQLTAADELTAAELRRKLALEEIRNEELRIQQIKEKADAIQMGPDGRREARREKAARGRAERRAERELALDARGGMAQADFDRAQRMRQPKIDIGPMQGPQLPARMNFATSQDIHTLIKEVQVVASKLGVNLP